MANISISPGAYRIAELMAAAGSNLADDWDEGGFGLQAAIDLAEHVHRADWRLTGDERDVMLKAGAILLRSVYHQVEAGILADRVLSGAMERYRHG